MLKNSKELIATCRLLAVIAMAANPIAAPVNTAAAGEFDSKNVSELSEWTSLECIEPSPPSYACESRETCAALVKQHNNFVRDMQYYFNCIKNEVRSDTSKIETMLDRKIDQLHDEAQKRADQSKVDMEAAITKQGFDVKYNAQ